MGKTVRHDAAPGLPLQAVVADRGSCGQRLFQIPRFQQLPVGIGRMTPYAGEAVRLQFLPHRQGIDFRLAPATTGLLDLVADPDQLLDMVTDFVGDDISLGSYNFV